MSFVGSFRRPLSLPPLSPADLSAPPPSSALAAAAAPDMTCLSKMFVRQPRREEKVTGATRGGGGVDKGRRERETEGGSTAMT